MELSDFKCINEDIDIELYQRNYKYVRDHMEHPEWLSTFTDEEIKDAVLKHCKCWGISEVKE